MEATSMSIDKWIETVVHIPNGMLLSHKNEHIWVSANEVDELRCYYTLWNKPEREKQISCINTYIESRKMVLMSLFAGRQWRRLGRPRWR